jgi:hypothetical protein
MSSERAKSMGSNVLPPAIPALWAPRELLRSELRMNYTHLPTR